MLVFSGEVMARRGVSGAASIPRAESPRASRTAKAIFMISPFSDSSAALPIMTPKRKGATEEFLTSPSGWATRRWKRPHGLQGGQDDPEETAPPFLALHFDTSTVRLHGPSGRGKAEPAAPGGTRSRGIDLVEPLEDPPLVRPGNADPRVPDIDRGLARRRSGRPHTDGTSPRRVLDRIVEQVDESLAHQGLITGHPHCGPRTHRQDLLFLLREDAQMLGDRDHQLAQIDGITAGLDIAGLPTGEGEQALDEPSEPIHLLQHAADGLAVDRRAEGVLKRDLSHAADRSKRRSKLV